MITLARPDPDAIRRFLEESAREPFSYDAVGATAEPEGLAARLAPDDVLDCHRARIGTSGADFERAVAALRRWQMFHLGWVELCWPTAPIEEGTTVAVLMRAFGVWSLNACRVVHRFDERNSAGGIDRFGFAYGTLRGHALRGEERFAVEWHRDDDTVWYELLRFARPAPGMPRVARPVARVLQKRFARDSLRAMAEALRG